MYTYLHADMARERHNARLAEAEAFRRARPARTRHRSTRGAARDAVRAAGQWRLRCKLVHCAVPVTETPA